ncbi:MAG: efflux RND transporter periplasmic adaptor subunit [Gammaproteobacteria bacterium]
MTRFLTRALLVLLVIGLCAGAIVALKQKKAAELAAMSERSMPPAAVSVAAVDEEQWRQSLFAVGTMAADQGIDVTAPLPGTVVDISFESGQVVARGDVLLSQDVGIQMAELEGLEATVELRELQFARAKRLLARKQMSQSDYDAARAARDEAEAALKAKRAFIERKRVYVPFDGVLGIRMVDLGTYLEPGDPIVPLQALDPIHVDYALPEHLLSRLAVGQVVEIEVPAYPGEKFRGRITAFEPGIDPATRNVRIRATLPNADQRLRPGMFAEVSTVQEALRPVLALPATAVTYSPYGNTVYVVVDDDGQATVERRQVRTGEVREGRVEIAEGLARGDRVVAVGQNKLRNGMPVKIAETVTAQVGSGGP